jgi:hypothetical protein
MVEYIFCERLFGQALLIEKSVAETKKSRQENCRKKKVRQKNRSRKIVTGKVRQKNCGRKTVAEKVR